MASSDLEHPTQPTRYVLRLYVAGDAPNSRIARENLRRLQERLSHCAFEIEIVDVLARTDIALARGIFVTPALEVLAPAPGALIYGNLSQSEKLRALFPEED